MEGPLLHLRSLVTTRASGTQIQGQPPQATRVPPAWRVEKEAALLLGLGQTQVRDAPWRRCLPLTAPPESRPGQPRQGPAAVAGRWGGQRRPTWALPPAARLRGLAGGGVAFQLAGRTPSRAIHHFLGIRARPSSSCTSGVCRGLKRHYAGDGRSANNPEMGGAASASVPLALRWLLEGGGPALARPANVEAWLWKRKVCIPWGTGPCLHPAWILKMRQESYVTKIAFTTN